jgi:hypothetical protein
MSVIDIETNNVSLLNVLEQINIAGPEPTENARALVPLAFEIVSLWERFPNDQPIHGQFRILVGRPSNAALGEFVGDVDLTEYIRTRSRTRVVGMEIPEAGRYEFRIQVRDDPDHDWGDVSRIPLLFIFGPLPE